VKEDGELMKIIKLLFDLIRQHKRHRMKNFQDLFDVCRRYLADGEDSISIGSLYVEITPKERDENGVSIRITVNSAVMVQNGGIMVRQSLFSPDSMNIYSHRKGGCLVYLYEEKDRQVHRCKFGMNASLKNLKKVFKNRHVNYIVNQLMSYGEA